MVQAQIGLSNGNTKSFLYELNNLTRHATILGTTGSGKTVMCKVLVEEALMQGIPVIAIDPKGDIGGLGIANEKFDFRPFIKNATEAKATAEKYVSQLKAQKVKLDKAKVLADIETKIYTPKSSVGIPVSLIPKLNAPARFKQITEADPMLIPNFVEPISESICELAGVSGSAKERAQALISSILIYNWNDGIDLTIASLITQINSPPFETLGSLELNDFINEKERKKLVASINLLLTSPSKQVWAKGEDLNIDKMFTPGNLSVFDLRMLSLEEKQMVVEQLLSEIYKYLLNKGGSEKLNYILYFDELAGILPPLPASPPCKKSLELLIRQARAFGLGIVLATQNPGDIDYKVLGNIGTRFIGRLRTENDIEKVAVAMDLVPSVLKEEVSKLATGDFVYNNAVDNKRETIHARWLYSYHGGPLSPEEVKLINDKSGIANLHKTEKMDIDIANIKKAVLPQKSSSEEYADDGTLDTIQKIIQKHSDDFKLQVAILSKDQEKVYVPHLKIVLEPKEYRGVKLELVGPYVFDLSSKAIPVGNYLKGFNWLSTYDRKTKVIAPKRNIEESILYAIKDSKEKLNRPVYKSTITEFSSDNFDEVVKNNIEYLKQDVKDGKERMKTRAIIDYTPTQKIIQSNNAKIDELKSRIMSAKTQRMLKRIISKSKHGSTSREIEMWEDRIDRLNRENDKLKAKIDHAAVDYNEKKEKLNDKAYGKAHTCIKEFSYRPKDSDLIVHATLYLAPKIETTIEKY